MAASRQRFSDGGFVVAWGIFFLIWMAATASLEPARVLTGLLLTAPIAGLASLRTSFWAGLGVAPRRVIAGIRLLLAFIWDMVMSNLAVLGYVYAPRIRVAPEFMTVPITVSGPRERLALTGLLTLTPGSLVIDISTDQLELHLLDAGLADGTALSVRKFERLLEASLG